MQHADLTPEEVALIEKYRSKTVSPEQAAKNLITEINDQRLAAEVTVAELAKKSGLQVTQLKNILGMKTDPKLSTICKILNALSLNLKMEIQNDG
mgnify:FL=1|jgi:DNA-binding phage protein